MALTYIIPSGWDKELVLKTSFKRGVDKVCLISAFKKKSHVYSYADVITQKVNREIVEKLSGFTKVESININYIDLKDIVVETNKYIKNHPEDQFIINISTGSHLLAATLMLVAQINNIPIEYSLAENHNPAITKLIEKGEDYHCGLSKIIEIPSLPFSLKLSKKEKSLLSKLQEKKVLQVNEFVEGTKGDKENRLRSEFHYLCKKLQKLGLIKIINKGKKIEARLTNFGEVFCS